MIVAIADDEVLHARNRIAESASDVSHGSPVVLHVYQTNVQISINIQPGARTAVYSLFLAGRLLACNHQATTTCACDYAVLAGELTRTIIGSIVVAHSEVSHQQF